MSPKKSKKSVPVADVKCSKATPVAWKIRATKTVEKLSKKLLNVASALDNVVYEDVVEILRIIAHNIEAVDDDFKPVRKNGRPKKVTFEVGAQVLLNEKAVRKMTKLGLVAVELEKPVTVIAVDGQYTTVNIGGAVVQIATKNLTAAEVQAPVELVQAVEV